MLPVVEAVGRVFPQMEYAPRRLTSPCMRGIHAAAKTWQIGLCTCVSPIEYRAHAHRHSRGCPADISEGAIRPPPACAGSRP
jgi:hypothetical protein